MAYMDNIALTVNQNMKITQALLNERETGSSTRAPCLGSIDDFPHWKRRFENYVNGLDTRMWQYIQSGYTHPKSDDNLNLSVSEMSDVQKKEYDAEKRAYSCLSQALPRNIYDQFRRFKSSSTLWQALELEYEGNAEMRAIQGKTLKQEFDRFCALRNESLNETVERYWTLLSEMADFGVSPNRADTVDGLAKALPAKWNSFLMVQRQNDGLTDININDFVTKLRKEEMIYKQREKHQSMAQDTSTSIHAPIKTAFVSQTSTSNNPNSSSNTSTSTSSYSSPTANPLPFKTENISKTSVEEVKDHMGLLTALVNSYDDLLAGQIGNPHLTNDDYDQIDRDEMDRIDIMWGMANMVRRAKDYVRRTGKELSSGRNTKYGFDMSAVTCYNCGEKGHFARQCKQPKQNVNKNPFTRNQEAGDSKATVKYHSGSSQSTPSKAMAVIQCDDGIDWSVALEKEDSQDIHVATIEDLLEQVYSDQLEECICQIISDDEERGVSDFSVRAEEKVAEPATETAFVTSKSKGIQVCFDESCLNCLELEDKVAALQKTNAKLLTSLNENLVIKNKEKQFKDKIDVLNTQVYDLEATVLRKQRACTVYIDTIDSLKRENATLKIDYETLDQKLRSYNNSAYLMEYMIKSQQSPTDKKGLGYHNQSPPYSYLPTPSSDPEIGMEPTQPSVSASEVDATDKGKSVENEKPSETNTEECKSPKLEEKVVGTITKSESKSVLSKTELDSNASTSRYPRPVQMTTPPPLHHNFVRSSQNTSPTRVSSRLQRPETRPKQRYVDKPTVSFQRPQQQRSETRPKHRPTESSVGRPTFRPKESSEGRSKSRPRDRVQLSPIKKNRRCYECGEPGHIVQTCPNLQKTNVSPNRLNRKSPAKSTEISQSSPPRVVDKRTCYHCKEPGHVVHNCPSLAKPYKNQSPRRVSRNLSPVKDQVNSSRVHEVKPLSSRPMRSIDSQNRKTSLKETAKATTASATVVTPPPGMWIEIILPGKDGKPLATKAWVPQTN